MAAKPATTFIRACSTGKPEVVRQLIQAGLSPNTTDNYGLTGLIWAGRKGQVEVAKALIEAGADLEAPDRRGRTALSHAVTLKRHAFVQFIASQGAFLNPVDAHGWTPLDLASMPREAKMVEILEQLGAERKATQKPSPQEEQSLNRFSSGGATGGPDLPTEVERIHIQLHGLLRRWTGDYAPAVHTLCFPLFVDASLIRYTDTMNLSGPQAAKRKKDWLEVRIGVPERWWREAEPAYKQRLAGAIEEGLHSMIALLQRNRHAVKGEQLLADWRKVRQEFLDTPAPPFPAEKQRAAMRSMMNDAIRALEARRMQSSAIKS